MKKLFIILALPLVLCSCAHDVSHFSPSFQNMEQLKQLKPNSQPISLGVFKDPKNTNNLSCRLEGSEYVPGHKTYVSYIQSALKTELKASGLYSSKSNKKLDATLDKVDFASMPGNGRWMITMTFNDHHQSPYSVSDVYKFSTNYVADIACTEVAQAFVPAVQSFLTKLYGDKHFIQTLHIT